MPFEARVFRVMVGSPSDVINDRKAVVEVVHEWNGVNAAEKEAILLPVLWEIDAPPLAGQPPQQTIREELVQDSDMLISLFWTRLGSPTENAESGTAEEIEEFVKAGKPVLVYLSNRQYSPQAIDPEQLERLRKFMDRNRERLLIRRYDTIEELKELLRRHLPATVRRLPGLQRSIDDVGIHPEGTHAAADSVQQRFHAARVEWDAERDSEPLGIASGKRVLESLEPNGSGGIR